jgi:peptidoglycan biosynthesis protein MviN/MurJ (putative lipid II flippase)
VLVRAFFARNEAMTSVFVGIGVVVLNLALNLTLVFGTDLGVSGLAWSTAICSIVQTVLLASILGRRIGGLPSLEVRRSALGTIIGTVSMGVVVWLLAGALPDDGSWSGQLLRLFVLVVSGGVVFVALAAVQAMPELRWAIGRDRA